MANDAFHTELLGVGQSKAPDVPGLRAEALDATYRPDGEPPRSGDLPLPGQLPVTRVADSKIPAQGTSTLPDTTINLDQLHTMTIEGRKQAAEEAARESECRRVAAEVKDRQEADAVLAKIPQLVEAAAQNGNEQVQIMPIAQVSGGRESREKAPSLTPGQQKVFDTLKAEGLQPGFEIVEYAKPPSYPNEPSNRSYPTWMLEAHWK